MGEGRGRDNPPIQRTEQRREPLERVHRRRFADSARKHPHRNQESPPIPMMFGHPSIFAIESAVTEAYEQLSLRALGFFVIYVGGHSYGLRSPGSTMLACSFDAVRRRIADRGK